MSRNPTHPGATRAGLVCMIAAAAVCVLPAATNERGAAEQTSKADRQQAKAEAAAELSPLLRAARDNRQLTEAPARVYTNDDLGSAPAPAPTPGDAVAAGDKPAKPAPGARPGKPQEADPLDWMAAQKTQAAERAQRVGAAEKRLEEARARVEMLQKRELAVLNPYRARPQMSDEEAEEWSALTTPQRAARTQADLAEARAEVEAAQRELDRARAGAPGS